MRFVYSPEQLGFLRAGWKRMDLASLTAAFNAVYDLDKTPSQIRSTLKNHRMTRGLRPKSNNQRRLLTQEQHDYLASTFTAHSRNETTAMLNMQFGTTFTVQQIVAYTKNHGIKSGRTGCFQKGGEAWNAGTKGLMKPNSGSFKKGQMPATTVPLGSERICTKDGYVLVKVSEQDPHTGSRTRFKHKHLVEWERVHGPVPAGHVVRMRDGDPTNWHIDNLVLLSRREHALLNKKYKLNQVPAELKDTVILVAKVDSRVSKLSQVSRDEEAA